VVCNPAHTFIKTTRILGKFGMNLWSALQMPTSARLKHKHHHTKTLTTKNPTPKMPKKNDPLLWIAALFGLGCIFYFIYTQNFLENFSIFLALTLSATALFFFNRNSRLAFVFAACGIFLGGSFYANFYEKNFIDHSITGKIYVDGVGKITEIKKFFNPINGLEGANLVISQPKLFEAKFPSTKIKKVKKKKNPKEKAPRKKRKTQKEKAAELGLSLDQYKLQRKAEKERKLIEKAKKAQKKIEENFVNLGAYQEIDRQFLDISKNYQQVAWVENKGRRTFPNPPQKISLNLVKNFSGLEVNDLVAFRALLQPVQRKEFPQDFDFSFDAKAKKIGAYGFILGEVKIIEKQRQSSIDDWFNSLREKINQKIFNALSGDEAAIASAFLIGKQEQISAAVLENIRRCGLAHLLSISGFHLSLAAAIFFVSLRFILSRFEYLALRFDLKKIAAIAAIFASFFYLQIAGAPLPAKRAFLMTLLALLALLFDEKINAKRAVMFALLFLILLNPYAIFNIGFQLSFLAILVLVTCSEEIFLQKKLSLEANFFGKIFNYFWQIIFISFALQIATLPFLMHSFRNVALLGFVSNLLAIPLASFFIMPLGFLALFLMPLGLEKLPLSLMNYGILLLEKIANFVAEIKFSNLIAPEMPGLGVLIAAAGILLLCLEKSRIRFVGIAIFFLSFATIFLAKKPTISFEQNQKFFTIYEGEKLFFSEKLRASKQRQHWMDRFDEKEFRYFETKNYKNFLIEKNKKILVLLKRNKISEICKNDFDVIVNMTSKYQLPACIEPTKIKIDNLDFYHHGSHFFYSSGALKTTF
jgi:competence protein ComEC